MRTLSPCLAVVVVSSLAPAQEALKVAHPPEAKPVASAPKTAEAPAIAKPSEGTTAAVSAGGLFGTGNAKILAGSVSGAYETRFGDWGAAASLSLGLECLQDVTDAERFRVVGEGVFAARISGGLSLGLGVGGRAKMLASAPRRGTSSRPRSRRRPRRRPRCRRARRPG